MITLVLENLVKKKLLSDNCGNGFIFLLTMSFCTITQVYSSSLSSESLISYDSVLIDYPNNANDVTGFGQVAYAYKIGKYAVTLSQYSAFLNHVATEADPYKLWNQGMLQPYIQGISRTESAGKYIYAVLPTYSSANLSSENMPITWVSWFSIARFANWLANGQPTGAESSGTSENGAYNLNGVTSGITVSKNAINPNTGEPPTYYIPSENEWYKAAYYNPMLAGGAGGYYVYATQSNQVPNNIIGTGANLANFLYAAKAGYCVTQSGILESATYLTNVGTFSGSPSYFGTFDQSGNVWEVNALTGQTSLHMGLRGAAWTSTPEYMTSSYRLLVSPANGAVNVGFRLSSPAE